MMKTSSLKILAFGLVLFSLTSLGCGDRFKATELKGKVIKGDNRGGLGESEKILFQNAQFASGFPVIIYANLQEIDEDSVIHSWHHWLGPDQKCEVAFSEIEVYELDCGNKTGELRVYLNLVTTDEGTKTISRSIVIQDASTMDPAPTEDSVFPEGRTVQF